MSEAAAKTAYLELDLITPTATHLFTNWSGDLGGGRISIPGMRVRIPTFTGTLEEQPLRVTLKRGVSTFLDALCTGVAAPAIRAQARLIFVGAGPGALPLETYYMGEYRLAKGIRNPDKEQGLIALEFLSAKARLNVPLGFPCQPQYPWTLGDKSCLATVVEETDEIVAIDRLRVTINGVTLTTDGSVQWQRGVVSFEGLSIGIRSWGGYDGSPVPLEFELVRFPPASWLNEIVTFRSGCRKTPTDCADFYNNIERFGGSGIKIPSHHPVLETP
jgi:hypothetical protein